MVLFHCWHRLCFLLITIHLIFGSWSKIVETLSCLIDTLRDRKYFLYFEKFRFFVLLSRVHFNFRKTDLIFDLGRIVVGISIGILLYS